MDERSIDERLRAVERTVTETEAPESVADAAALAERVDDVEALLDDVAERLDEQEAAIQALRGYVGAVRGVNRDVERRADSALAKVERLEAGSGRDREAARERRGRERRRPDQPEHPIPEPRDDGPEGLLDRVTGWL